MSLCALCGVGLYGDDTPLGMCRYHAAEDDWSVANRVFCDWLHRQIEPAPVTSAVRFDDVEAAA